MQKPKNKLRVISGREKRKKVKTLFRELSSVDAERKFSWKTPTYQKAHTELLDRKEERIRRELEKIL